VVRDEVMRETYTSINGAGFISLTISLNKTHPPAHSVSVATKRNARPTLALRRRLDLLRWISNAIPMKQTPANFPEFGQMVLKDQVRKVKSGALSLRPLTHCQR
jgi:hypothetical protein